MSSEPTRGRLPAAQAIVRLLAERGIDRAFCVPGESYLPLLDALQDSAIDLVVCRHESGAGFAALADAQATRRAGLFLVSRGPGATNGSIAIHSAMHDALPVVMICGQVARDEAGRHAFQDMDYRQVFGTVAKWVTQVDEPQRLLETMARALDVACSGRPGPVVVAIPEDVFEAEVSLEGQPVMASACAGPQLDAALVDSLAGELARAQRPLIIGGSLINTPAGREALARLARTLRVPVAVDFRQQDLLPNDDPLYAAHLGFKIPPAQVERLAQADLILALGTDLGDTPTQRYTFPRAPVPTQRLVHVYPDAEVAARVYQPQLRCIADPVLTLQALAARAGAHADAVPAASRDAWIGTLQDYLRGLRTIEPIATDDGVCFGDVVAALDRHMADDGVLVIDSGNFNTWTQRCYGFRGERRMSGTMAGAMGMGVPGALAWSLRCPGRQVVALVGDGCVLMTGNELATAVQHGAAPRLFIADNGSYGTIRLHQEKRFPGRVAGTRLANPDFARWGESFGATAWRIDRAEEVDATVAAALGCPGPAVVQVRTSLRRLSAFYTMTPEAAR